MQPFPHPNDASYKIWSTLANWPQRYSSFIWITTEWLNDRIPERQGKSSIAPLFQSRAIITFIFVVQLIFLAELCFTAQSTTLWRSYQAWSVNLHTLFLGRLRPHLISSHLSPLTLEVVGHHRWRCNNTFPSFPVFCCPQGISKPHSRPFLDVIFPSLLLSSGLVLLSG